MPLALSLPLPLPLSLALKSHRVSASLLSARRVPPARVGLVQPLAHHAPTAGTVSLIPDFLVIFNISQEAPSNLILARIARVARVGAKRPAAAVLRASPRNAARWRTARLHRDQRDAATAPRWRNAQACVARWYTRRHAQWH